MNSLEPYIHRRIVILHQELPARQAIRAMCERGIGCVMVCDQKSNLVGIVTDRDMACSILESSSIAEMPLSEIMTRDPKCVAETDGIENVASLMETLGIRRVPVIKSQTAKGKKCVGIVTLDDLAASKAIGYTQLSNIIRAQIRRRRVPKGLPTSRAEQRSEAHIEQTLNHFYKRIAEKTGLSGDALVSGTQYILGALIRRLHYTGASHLIAQLPKGLQDDLLDLPAGPDRKITIPTLVDHFAKELHLNEKNAEQVLTSFFLALEELIDPGEIEDIKAQLPLEFRHLFGPSHLPPGESVA